MENRERSLVTEVQLAFHPFDHTPASVFLPLLVVQTSLQVLSKGLRLD